MASTSLKISRTSASMLGLSVCHQGRTQLFLNMMRSCAGSTLLTLPLHHQSGTILKDFKICTPLLTYSLMLLPETECVQELQSSLRRKGSDSKEAAGKYLAGRKAVKKLIQKALRNWKGLQTTKNERDTCFMVSMLREVEKVTLSALESLLSFVSGPKDQSLVSKLMLSKSFKSESTNEFEQIDVSMQSIVKHKQAVGTDNIQTDVADLQLSIIEDLESGVECLYRHLIKTRVTFLNIVSN